MFILGDVLALNGEQAAEIVGVTHDVYRKRLSRVRGRIRDAVTRHCGIVNPSAACRCQRRVDVAVRTGRVQPNRPRFVERSAVDDAKRQIQDLHDVANLFRSAGASTAQSISPHRSCASSTAIPAPCSNERSDRNLLRAGSSRVSDASIVSRAGHDAKTVP